MNPAQPQETRKDTTVVESPRYRIQVVDRAFAILELLANQNSNAGVAEISKQLGLNKTTTHRLLKVLEHHGYVEKNGPDGKYGLGSKLFELGRVGSQGGVKVGLVGAG